MRDSIGVEIEPGDYVLSAAPSTGRLKVGIVEIGSNNNLILKVHASYLGGTTETRFQARSQISPYHSVVLRKHDGTIPTHIRRGGT